jgi:putative glycosyltransferase (TIGR04372 family)
MEGGEYGDLAFKNIEEMCSLNSGVYCLGSGVHFKSWFEEKMIIDRVIDYVSDRKNFPFVLLSPLVYVVGNCAEEIYFGLLKARREGKKLYILRPYNVEWLLKYRLTNQELFRIESDYCYSLNGNCWEKLVRFGLTALYTPFRIFSLLLRKYSGRGLNESYSFPRIGLMTLWQPKRRMKKFSKQVVHSFDWVEQLNRYLPVRLGKKSFAKAEEIKENIGIGKEDWFVCLHVREAGFHDDFGRREWRNSSISNYMPALKAITEAGGWVIRMGDNTMTPLPQMDKVIDYPFSPFKSDLMDVYLISECKFYIASQSGILDVAFLFQKPVLIPNMVTWSHQYPLKKGDLGIMKHVYSHSQGRFLSIKELFESDWAVQEISGSLGQDYKMYENSPEEIKALVCEYLNSLGTEEKKLTTLQENANMERILNTYRLFEGGKVPGATDDHINMMEKYRIASRVESSLGALGKAFLKENWEKSSKN